MSSEPPKDVYYNEQESKSATKKTVIHSKPAPMPSKDKIKSAKKTKARKISKEQPKVTELVQPDNVYQNFDVSANVKTASLPRQAPRLQDVAAFPSEQAEAPG